MDIQVGDLVTFENGIVKLIYDSDRLFEINQYINGGGNQILKIERPKYEVVEEKKELLTEEEKEFLKDICKYYDVKTIYFNKTDIGFYIENDSIINASDYPKNIKFNKVKRNKYYTLKELGLE